MTAEAPARTRVQADPLRRTAFLAGLFFLLTFVSAVVGLLLYGPLLDDPRYVLEAGADAQIALGAACEIVLVISNIATAVLLFPVLKRRSETLALAYVAARVLESTVIVIGIVSVLAVVTLRQTFAAGGADAGAFLAVSSGLVAVHDWTFLLGPAFAAGLGNGLILGWLMYSTGLVPRPMALFGLIGGPLLLASATAVLFGLYEQTSAWAGLATLPEMIWEAFLGIYLLVRGFRPAVKA
jgi:hypothetical protein